jgi:hypothetical protein
MGGNPKTFATERRLHAIEKQKWWGKWWPLNIALIILLLMEWRILFIRGEIEAVICLITVMYAPVWAIITRSFNRWGLIAIILAILPLFFIFDHLPGQPELY